MARMKQIKLPGALEFKDRHGNEHRINIYSVFGAYMFVSNRLAIKFTFDGAVKYYAGWLEELDQI